MSNKADLVMKQAVLDAVLVTSQDELVALAKSLSRVAECHVEPSILAVLAVMGTFKAGDWAQCYLLMCCLCTAANSEAREVVSNAAHKFAVEKVSKQTSLPQNVCRCFVTTNIAEELEFGTGKLSCNGFWEVPCTHRDSQGNLLPGMTRGTPDDFVKEVTTVVDKHLAQMKNDDDEERS